MKLIDMDEPAQCFPVAYASAADVVRCNVVRCWMLLLDDGCREEYLCVERIICEGCKKVTWLLNGLFNIYTYQFVR